MGILPPETNLGPALLFPASSLCFHILVNVSFPQPLKFGPEGKMLSLPGQSAIFSLSRSPKEPARSLPCRSPGTQPSRIGRPERRAPRLQLSSEPGRKQQPASPCVAQVLPFFCFPLKEVVFRFTIPGSHASHPGC